MKTTFTLLLAGTICFTAGAQSTAMDFSANDCYGVPHQCFEDLDAGICVVIDIVQTGHTGCADGVSQIAGVIGQCDAPGLVHHYTFGAAGTDLCANMLDWCDDHGFSHPVFAGMNELTSYYGGAGEPRVVVLGGSDHAVFLNAAEHHAGNNGTLLAAVNSALAATTGVREAELHIPVRIWPNPAADMVTVEAVCRELRLVDGTGKVVLLKGTNGNTHTTLDLSGLPVGLYILQLIADDGRRTSRHLVKQ